MLHEKTTLRNQLLAGVLAVWMLLCAIPQPILAAAGEAAAQAAETAGVEEALNLDSIAWEELTYRDIFITNNLAYVDGFNQKSYEPFYQKLGQNEITNAAYYTSPYSLYTEGSGSQYLQHSVTLPEAGDYFVASKAKCTRYVQGTLGMCLYSTAVGVQGVTEDFVTTAEIVTERKGAGIFAGSFKTADLDGYVDDPVVVNMAIFETAPTLEQLETLYENYVAYEKAQPREEIPHTDGEMLDAFVSYMNEKAASIRMSNSQFNDPVGMDNLTTAYDLMRLMVYAYSNYGDLNTFWGTDDYTISVGGISNRDHVLESSYWDNPYLEPYYHIVGAKGGSLSGPKIYNLAAILEIPSSDDKLAVVALYSDGKADDANGSRAAVKQAADAAMIKYLNPDADNSGAEVCCQSAIACLIPAEGANLSNLQILYSKDADTQRAPASISKVLTSICVLDLQKDLSNTITYKSADTDIGGFYVKDFVPGETVTYEDAMYALMLKSSNVTAMALARSSGEVLLKSTHTHDYTAVVTPPTCTEQGYTSHTCTCGDSYVDSYVPATGHTYENGVCSACGKEMLRITKSDLVQYQGGVNSLNGTLNTTFTNNWYSDIRIPKGAQQVRYLTFKTGGDWGVAFLQDGTYLSGACDKTTGGQWVTADIPVGATTFRYGYLYDTIAAQNGLPSFEYVEFIGEDLEQWEQSDYLPRPATGCHSFSVEVNIAPAQGNPNGYVKGTDYGYIQLPTNYSAYGEPTRLIIACHGAGASLSTYKSSAWKNTNYSFWTDLGYAVMDMYASPQELTGSDSALHYGNPVVLECYKKGYDYVMQHFNLKQDGIFLIGASMGGLSSFQIAQSGQFPVIAQVAYCPVIDLFKQAYCNPWTTASYQRSHIASYFGFTGTAPAFTNNRYPSLQEIEFFRQNSDKVTAYSPILRNVIAGNIASLFDVVPSSPTAASAEEAALYAGLTATHPNPLMVFHNTDDSAVAYRYSQYFVEMVNRSGQEAILRTFTSGNHNAWANGASKTVQGLNGTITIKESQYEAYLFFDKFERHETHCAWIDPAKVPTCDQTGLTQGSHCAVCGEVLQKQETVPATGHKFSVYTADGNATYETDGTKTALCDHGCGAKDTVADVGSMLFPKQVTSSVYTISDGILGNVPAGTTVSVLLSGLDWGKYCTVFDTNGNAVDASAKVATGMVVKLLRDSEVKQTLTIAVRGDTSGDGAVTLTDFVQIKAHLLQKQILTGAAVTAADYSADGSVTMTDFMQVKALLLRTSA